MAPTIMPSNITNGARLHIVDDDEAIRDALSWLFQSRSVPVAAWPSAEAFLQDYEPDMAGCLLLDIRMEGMGGLELFDRLRELGCRMPVLFLTGHGDVPIAVSALKKGARDFVEKPFNDNDLVDRVIEALAFDAEQREREAGQAGVAARLGTLTQRERQVMELVVAGKLNKVIADDLGISMRTVEVHRAHVFEKMGVKTAVELARLLAAVG
ncbi:response regulator transcription factor [Azospirillum soli]|uniref:response regulator transcription factor n=1 Tax=Azospirillum soli TaxID=1304799 RepID=UPI001FE9522F|nr:response regulator [Azospirillum soli]MBP2312527.1 two-component system response regulator DctR [Azospirillum soli]